MPVYGTKSPTPALKDATGGRPLNPFVHPALEKNGGMHHPRKYHATKSQSYKIGTLHNLTPIESPSIAFMYETP
jgi:hypothetical protein